MRLYLRRQYTQQQRGAGGPAAARGAFSFSLLLLAGICRRAAPFTTTCDVLTRVHIYLL